MRRMTRILALLIALASGVALAAGAHLGLVGKNGLSPPQADKVVRIVLRHESIGAVGPKPVLEMLNGPDGRALHPGYYTFGVSTDDPSAGATTNRGLFAVSRTTADVWELNLCHRYVFSDLARVQAEVRARTGVTLEAETALRDGLGCGS